MLEEPHNITLTPYHYCNNNPILFIDFNGEDWFVNGKTGTVLYLKGVTELTDEVVAQVSDSLVQQGEKDGVDYVGMFEKESSTGNWDSFGADDMFDSKDNQISEGCNQLMFGNSARNFMGSQGYDLVVNETSESFSVTMWDNPTFTQNGGEYSTNQELRFFHKNIVTQKELIEM